MMMRRPAGRFSMSSADRNIYFAEAARRGGSISRDDIALYDATAGDMSMKCHEIIIFKRLA